LTIWFYSDPHFGHAGIIDRCGRPYDSVQEMDEKLIQNYQKCVKPRDDVYILGDVAMKGSHEKILRRLPGNKHLIVGNHDWNKNTRITDSHKEALRSWGYAWVKDTHLLCVKNYHGPKDHLYIWLAHYAHLTWPKKHSKGAWHLFGHSHGNLEGTGLSTDVGVDCWDYAPVSLSQIKEHLSKKEKHGPQPSAS